MKIFTGLLVFSFFISSYFVFSQENVVVKKTSKKQIAQRGRYYGNRRRGGVRFRFYFGPRNYRRGYYYQDYGYYYHQISINIREDAQAGEKISKVSIDGYRIRLKPSTLSGNRGVYYYRVNPGYHMVRWTVERPYGKTQTYDYGFYTDRYNQYTYITIDGDQIFIN
jgi:hypothetical protein